MVMDVYERKLSGFAVFVSFFVASLVFSVARDILEEKKMLKKVWPHPVDFCIRFRTIPDNPT